MWAGWAMSCPHATTRCRDAARLTHSLVVGQAVGLDRTVFVIPAFFELLLHLKARRQSFSLVFRTFGHELAPVVTEFNAFCEGRHPLYPSARFDGA